MLCFVVAVAVEVDVAVALRVALPKRILRVDVSMTGPPGGDPTILVSSLCISRGLTLFSVKIFVDVIFEAPIGTAQTVGTDFDNGSSGQDCFKMFLGATFFDSVTDVVFVFVSVLDFLMAAAALGFVAVFVLLPQFRWIN